MELETLLRIINLIAGTLVALIGATIVILTYLKAKETILQPMKNEVFKMQLTELSSIMNLFIGKGGVKSFWDIFDFEKIIEWNTFILIDAFLILKNSGSEPEERPYNKDNSINYIGEFSLQIKKPYIFFVIPDYVYPTSLDKFSEIIKQTRKQWESYQHISLMLPKEIWNTRENIKRLYSSPVMPLSITNLLIRCDQTLEKNFDLLKQALTKCSKILLKFVDTDISNIPKSELELIPNIVRNEFIKMQHKENFSLPKKVVQSVRDYLGSDTVLKK